MVLPQGKYLQSLEVCIDGARRGSTFFFEGTEVDEEIKVKFGRKKNHDMIIHPINVY